MNGIGAGAADRHRRARGGDCLSQAATDYLAALIAGGSVRLNSDLSDRDQFNRLLRYVMADGRFINADLVRQGYATAPRPHQRCR